MERSVAFVTGSSGGFGMGTSIALAKAGFQVIASMRNLEKQGLLEEQAKRTGVWEQIEVAPLDVTSPDSVKLAVAHVRNTYGSIDVLVNNAGVAVGGYAEEVSMEEWRRQFETNFFGLVAVTNEILPLMRERGKGIIINISSISGRVGFPGLAPYVASKHAVEGYSESLRLEMLPYGVYVSLIEPGSFKTSIWEKSRGTIRFAEDSPYASHIRSLNRMVDQIEESAPLPDRVVELIVHVAKESAPRLRYPVGRGVRTMLLAKKVLPWQWLERIIQKQIRL